MSDRPPLIGITTYAVNAQGNIPLPHEYVESVRRAGGVPVLIPPGEKELLTVVHRVDGLILAGGGDVCPTRYGGPAHDAIYMVDPERDETEVQLIQLVLQRRLPTLAICRGLQVLNVTLGGSLHAHLPDVVGERILHRGPPREPVPHPVEFAADSRLADVIGALSTSAVSWHHQAIDRLGAGCRVVARSADGVIEAIEVADHPEVMAVQWHPELSSAQDAAQQRLFDRLVAWAADTVD